MPSPGLSLSTDPGLGAHIRIFGQSRRAAYYVLNVSSMQAGPVALSSGPAGSGKSSVARRLAQGSAASIWALMSLWLVACRLPTRREKDAAQSAVPSSPSNGSSAAPVLAASAQRSLATPEAQHVQGADWQEFLLPDGQVYWHGALQEGSQRWLDALVGSPAPTWPHLERPIETNRLELTFGKPDFRDARVGTRSCPEPGPCRALVLPIKLRRAVRGPAVKLELLEEVRGGPFPWTPLQGCSKKVGGSDTRRLPWTCGPLYLAESESGAAGPTRTLSLQVTSSNSPELPLRLDWRGTGSVMTEPLIANARGDYALQIFIVFEEQGRHWVSASQVFEIRLE